MKRILLTFAFILQASLAWAGCNVGALPFQLQNNTIADATQVMADFNQIVTGVQANCAAAGANLDITSLGALTTPLSAGQGGTTRFLGGTSGGSATAQTVTITTPASGFSLTAGYKVSFAAGFTTTGATTLNVNSTGAINVLRISQTGLSAFTGNEWIAGQRITVEYDGTQWEWSGILSITDLLSQFAITGNNNLYGAQGSFWTDIADADGAANARIHAFRDRVMVDDAVLQSGAWNSGNGGLANSRSGTAINSVDWNWATRDGSLNSISSWGELAIVGQSVVSSANRSGDPHTVTGGAAIGVAGFGLNDRTSNLVTAWGGYFEALRKTTGVGTALAIESDIGNVGSIVDLTPFSSPSGATGHTVNLWAQCGGSAAPAITYSNCTAAAAFGNNGARYRKGIIFFNTGLDASVGAGGTGLAIEFGDGQSFRWLNSGLVTLGEVWSTSANAGTLFLAPKNNLQLNGANSWSGNGSVATVLGSTGPTGSHTAPQVWLTVLDNTGTLRYIPAF